MAAVLAGSAELVAGFSLAAGLLTPVGTVLVGAVMITAILKVHVSNGIWASEGGFEFPLVLLTCPVCETEKAIHSLAYEPRFEPSVASVHGLHPREGAAVDALDRAA